MNQDIVYEILRNIYLDGNALIARRIMFSKKSFNSLRSSNIDKPVVFTLNTNVVRFISELCPGSLVYWGDGTTKVVTEANKKEVTHHYNVSQKYTIRIYGQKNKLVLPKDVETVESIGEMTNLAGMLQNCRKVNNHIGDKWDTSEITNMTALFSKCFGLNYNVGKNWNTSKVTTFEKMFYECIILNQNIGKNWDTSNVKRMNQMFFDCFSLNKSIGLHWNTSNVIWMDGIFAHCYALNKAIGRNWDTSNVTTLADMFNNCHDLEKFGG